MYTGLTSFLKHKRSETLNLHVDIVKVTFRSYQKYAVLDTKADEEYFLLGLVFSLTMLVYNFVRSVCYFLRIQCTQLTRLLGGVSPYVVSC